MYHQCWKKEGIAPFNELIVSWNAQRPKQGVHLIEVRVLLDMQWSNWLPIASWGKESQTTFSSQWSCVKIYQDALEVKEGKMATGFEVKTDLPNVFGLHVYTNAPRESLIRISMKSIDLPVPPLSQMQIKHERCRDLCSPTSTTAVIRYLSKNNAIDPVVFACSAKDQGFDIFGNWVLNVAAAFALLGEDWQCWVERLSCFEDLYAHLEEGVPVIVSVKGPLVGSALPYKQGHLIVVRGFDLDGQRVLCMDPAFESDEQTLVSYPIADFLAAWGRRGYIAYIFQRSKC